MDVKTGKVLYQKDPDFRLPPASTTKIITAIVTLESGRKPKEILTVSKGATRVPASKLSLQPGQTISIEDLLYGVLLSSANDAAMVLAESIGGSVEGFAEMMTNKAHEIGATNTHFSNPHGLTAPDHYSTARDLAVIFRYAMNNPTFRQIVQTKMSSVKSIVPGRKKARTRLISVRNHNRLLWNFDGAIGGKTGYTHAAQKCFVGAAERDGATLIVSLLGSRDLWGDTRRLLEYGFQNYDTLKAAAQTPGRAGMSEQAFKRPERLAALISKPEEQGNVNAGDGYILQLASFREKERAESLRRQISDKGFEAFLEKTELSKGETAYRVRVGPYPALLEAQEMAQEILIKSGYRALILPAQAPREASDNPS